MRGWAVATAFAFGLGVGWARGRTPSIADISDPVVAGALDVVYGSAPRATPATGRPVVVAFDPDRPRARVDERFLSVALDTSQVVGGRWWSPDADHIEVARGDRPTTPFDLVRPRLHRLAAALAPAYLRIGGTEADVTYYDMSGSETHRAPLPDELVLTRARWDAVNAFARDVGFELLFTVNAGPGSRGQDGRWRSQNADSLLEYTRAAGYDVPVWELGNEVNVYFFTHGLSSRISGKQYAQDFDRFRSRVHAVFPGSKVAGPAAFYWPVLGQAGSAVSDFMHDFLEAGGGRVDVITWHFYPQQSRRCPLATRRASVTRLLDPPSLDEPGRWADAIRRLSAVYAPAAQAWLDESGNAQCGGEPGVSDRFVSSLWWLDELGLAATHGQRVVVRQTLAGSDYGLIDDAGLRPSPDYWASLLWKRLMGSIVLDVRTTADDPSVRAYAHCTPAADGGVSLLLLNLHPSEPARVRLEGRGSEAARLYQVTATSLTSGDAYLNGALLRFGEGLPAIEPRTGAVAGGVLDLPPASYSFVVLPAAAAAACTHGEP